MVELQSCSSLVHSPAICGIEQHENTNAASIIAEISAELERERQKNTQLLEKIAILEAQIQEKERESLLINQHGSNSLTPGERSSKKFKRRKTETTSRVKTSNDSNQENLSHLNQDADCTALKDANKHRLVSWMSMDETQFFPGDKFKAGNSALDCDYADDSDDEDDDCFPEKGISTDRNNKEIHKNIGTLDECEERINEGNVDDIQHRISYGHFSDQIESTKPMGKETNKNSSEDIVLYSTQADQNESEFIDQRKKQIKVDEDCKPAEALLASKKSIFHAVRGSLTVRKKPPKVAFCPKEVKRILESEVLKSKNAQSHTMRKIIVFSSLGIRHGCEDMYELDFNHFRIMTKGEPYSSPDSPGEHVLYENPGIQRKIFYPNKKNPTLCPVQILEEEKLMRPSDDSCPSHLFLCIKYGGRTRNLPQNEYVRQRMGRNKLKSFGPIMCKIATLIHIRTGSFFFKALGITLLFMAGFPDELVQRETKYRNLDLVQKYYRTDEDAEGEELFLPDSMIGNPEACPSLLSCRKTTSNKSKGKKQINFTTKPHYPPRPMNQPSLPLISAPSSQFGLSGYTSTQTHIVPASQSMPSQSTPDSPSISNLAVSNLAPHMGYHGHTPYPMLPPHPANSLMPMMYWPHDAFSPGLYPSTYGYRSFSPLGSYFPIHPYTFYGHPYSSIDPKIGEGTTRSDAVLEETNADSESSSSSTEP